MVISIALLGIAASGIWLNLQRKYSRPLFESEYYHRMMLNCLSLFSLSVPVAFLLVNLLPTDYYRLFIDPIHFLFFTLSFLLLALPFFFSGLGCALAYSVLPDKSGQIYFASMTGSAAGALIPALLIPLIGLKNAILTAGILPIIAALPFFLTKRGIRATPQLLAGIPALLLFLLPLIIPKIGQIEPSPYKLLSQYKQFPDAVITGNSDTIRGRFTSLESPFIRFAPGLSLKYRGTLPKQTAIIRDGDQQSVLYDIDFSKTRSFAPFCLSYVPYYLRPSARNILIVQKGGGLALACALAAESDEIHLVEEIPLVARTFADHYNNQALSTIVADPRMYLARSEEEFDIIQIESWGSSLPGMESMRQEHLFTEEALGSFISHLSEDGLLVISRRLLMPPADSLRLITTLKKCLTTLIRDSKGTGGNANPANHIIMLRSWDSFTLVIGKSPYGGNVIERLKDFSVDRNFDLVFFPGITEGWLNRFHVFEKPFYYEALMDILNDQEQSLSSYPLDISPRTDDLPYHNRYLRWDRVKSLIEQSGERFYAFILTGEVVTILLFATTLILSFLLLFLPIIVASKKPPPLLIYFLSLGVGFMFIEMGFIKIYTFLFGDPILAFSFVLGFVLLFSGLGGFVSDRIDRTSLRHVLIILALLSLTMYTIIPILSHVMLALPAMLRILIAIILIAPISFLLGFPFPAAMRLLLTDSSQRAYAWAGNGSASVLASIASVHVAMNLGISRLFILAALAYLTAMAVFLHFMRKRT